MFWPYPRVGRAWHWTSFQARRATRSRGAACASTWFGTIERMDRPVISFLTDFGPDGPAPICRGVMLTIARDAQIVDIGHNVRKYAIRDGAFLLWCALPY